MEALLIGHRHIAHLCPAALEVLDSCEVLVTILPELMLLQLFEDGFFLLQVVGLRAATVGEVLSFLGEELVARCTETLPYLLTHLTARGANRLPLLLQLEQFLGGLLPILSLGNGFRFQTEVDFLLIVSALLITYIAEVFLLLGVMLVDHSFELRPYLFIHLARNGAYRLPHLKHLVKGHRRVVPLLGGSWRMVGQFGGFIYEGLLGQQVVVQLLLALVVVLFPALVDLIGRITEALPYFLVLLVGHRANLLPAGSQVLQTFEGLGDRVLHDKFFGLFTELDLLLKIALLVEGAKLAVNL